MATLRDRTKSGNAYAALLFGLLAALYASIKVSDPDTWWYLAGGKLILSGSLPTTNTFSHTFPDYPWRFTQWFFALLMAMAERVAGITGVGFFQALCVAVAFVMAAFVAKLCSGREKWRLEVFLPLFILALSAARPRFAPRAHVASLLGIMVVFCLLEKRPKRLGLWLFVTAAVWSNLHAGVGLVTLGMVLYAAWGLAREGYAQARTYLTHLAAFFAGTLCNPYGYYTYDYLFQNTEFAETFSRIIGEFKPLAWNPIFYPFFIYAALSLPLLAFALSRKKYGVTLLSVGLLLLSFRYNRFIDHYVIFSLPLVYSSLLALLERAAPSGRFRVGISVSLGVAALIATSTQVMTPAQRFNIGWGENAGIMPVGACDYVDSRNLHGNLFTEFNTGGYIAWRFYPKSRTFVDSRAQTYPFEFLKAVLTPGDMASFAASIDGHGVDTAIVQRFPGSKDAAERFESLGWKLVYFDASSYVFVRPGSTADSKTARDELRFVKPYGNPQALMDNAGAFPAEVAQEIRRLPLDRLSERGDYRILGMAAQSAGELALAESIFSRGMEANQRDLQLKLAYGYLLQETGRRERAREIYLHVMKSAVGTELEYAARSLLDAL